MRKSKESPPHLWGTIRRNNLWIIIVPEGDRGRKLKKKKKNREFPGSPVVKT